MPVDLSAIPAEDRDDFQKRLQVYGIEPSAVQEPLSVAASSVVALAYGPDRPSARQPHVLETTDLAQVKRWVGVEDRIGQQVSARLKLPGRIDLATKMTTASGRDTGLARTSAFRASAGMAMSDAEGGASTISDDDLRMLDADDIDNVRLAARAFVRGDSRMVSSFEPLFTRVVGRITIPVWPLLSIHVARGSVLEFGTGVHALVAHQITIDPGGKIVSRGHLTVSCTKMQKGSRIVVRPALTGGVGTLSGGFRPIFTG